MKSYIDLIQQTFEFPTMEFHVNEDNELLFNNVPLMDIIKEHGTPLKINYLPKIGEHIENAKMFFRNAFKRLITKEATPTATAPSLRISVLCWKRL